MDVTRSVASPSDDIKKAAVFEKDALLSAQTMIYVRGRRTLLRHRRDIPHSSHAGRRRDEEDAAGRRLRTLQAGSGGRRRDERRGPGGHQQSFIRLGEGKGRDGLRALVLPDAGGSGATGGMLGALKCDAFIDLDWSSDAANKPFKTLLPSGRLYTGETDGSSFPNGGLRATHTAAAFTSWDRSSPCFAYDKGVRIPCAFVTHYGRAIDDKTPLLRSQDAVAREGLRLLKSRREKEASTMYAIGLGAGVLRRERGVI